MIDLGWTRDARVEIIAELDWESANDFWTAGTPVQKQVLQALAGAGIKIVVGTSYRQSCASGMATAGATQFWAHGLEPSPRLGE